MEPGLLVGSLEGFRRSLIRIAIIAAALWALLYPFNDRLILILTRPLPSGLAYFKVSEAFLTTLKVSLYAALFLLVPLIFREVWRAAGPLLLRGGRQYLYPVVLSASILFYGGTVICYLVVLPAGIKFLTAYGRGQMEPLLSAGRYLTFAVAFLFGFGLTFEMPLIMLLLSRAGIVNHQMLIRKWRYAILGIVVVSAIITPTPDIYNMSLMAAPLATLYGASIILVRLFGKATPR